MARSATAIATTAARHTADRVRGTAALMHVLHADKIRMMTCLAVSLRAGVLLDAILWPTFLTLQPALA